MQILFYFIFFKTSCEIDRSGKDLNHLFVSVYLRKLIVLYLWDSSALPPNDFYYEDTHMHELHICKIKNVCLYFSTAMH